MPGAVPEDVRVRVIHDYARGYSVDDIAKRNGVSVGSVHNYVAEFKQGRYTEYSEFLPFLEATRRLAQQLQASQLSLGEASVGIAAFQGISELGIEPKALKQFYEMLRGITNPEFPLSTFARAAVTVAKLEVEKGMPYDQIHTEANALRSEIERLRKERDDLVASRDSIKAETEKAQQTRLRMVQENGLTENDLEQYRKNMQTLHDAGLHPSDLKTAVDVIRSTAAAGSLEAAIELSKLEAETGKDHFGLLSEYRRTMTANQEGKAEFRKLNEQLDGLRSELVKVLGEESAQLQRNRLTKQQLENHTAMESKLRASGVGLDQVEKLHRILQLAEEAGWDARRLTEQLAAISNLQAATQQARAEYERVAAKLAQKKQETQTQSTLQGNIKTAVAACLQELNQKEIELNQLDQQKTQSKQKLDLAEAFFTLLKDPGAVQPFQLLEFIAELERVFKARFNPHAFGLPIDYGQVRAKFTALLRKLLE